MTDKPRIQPILSNISLLEELSNCTEEEFLASPHRIAAILHYFTIIGEAFRQISPELRHKHPEIPWRKIIGMSNLIVHDYTDTNYSMIWETIEQDLSTLKAQLLDILVRM